MALEMSRVRVVESPQLVERYEILKELGKEIFAGSDLVEKSLVSEKTIGLAKEFLAQAAQKIIPPVRASWWEHSLISPELGKQVTKAVIKAKPSLIKKINPLETELNLYLHDIGRLVTPGAYFRNDLICNRLLREMGIPKKTIERMFSLESLMEVAEGKVGLDEYFDSLSLSQKIIFLADNLGKRDKNGKLFDLDIFLKYLSTESGRYAQTSPWPSVARSLRAREHPLIYEGKPGAYVIVKKTVDWLESLGINFEEIRRGLENYGPKFVILARHGELDINPESPLYNRDQYMKPEDIVHLSDEGREQMEKLGDLIKERQFRPVSLFASPETRTRESVVSLRETLELSKTTIDSRLDDIESPGAYLEGYKMADLPKIEADSKLIAKLRKKYPHEEVPDLVKRMETIFWQQAKELKAGETGVFISHGDPISYLAYHLLFQKIPSQMELREKMYCPKGNALVAVIDSNDQLFTLFFIRKVEKDKIY